MEVRGLKPALRLGLPVFTALMVLAVGEYVLGITMDSGNLPYMIFMNVVDATLIVWYFMHVAHLWRPEE